MHPIEHLRYVARATGADPASLVAETAIALQGLQNEPAGLVLACRRIIERHPTVGPLWWLCAKLLSSPEPFELADELAAEIARDASADHLARELPSEATLCVVGWSPVAMQAAVHRGDCRVLVIDSHGDGQAAVNALERADVRVECVALEAAAGAVVMSDVVIIEALACGPTQVLCAGGSHGVASIAYCASRPSWLVAGVGTRLPEPLWSAMKNRIEEGRELFEVATDVVALEMFANVIGSLGVADATPEALAAECAPTPELLRRSAM